MSIALVGPALLLAAPGSALGQDPPVVDVSTQPAVTPPTVPPLPDLPGTGPPAQPAPGGVSAPGRPVAGRVSCKTACIAKRKARTGSVVKINGRFLDRVQYMVFRGASGPMPVSLTYRDSTRIRAIVPAGALSSRPYVIAEGGTRSNRTKRKLSIRPAPAVSQGIFPVRGPHSFGGAGSRFGAPRSGHSHQGQDVAAACGTPLASVMAGTVEYRGFQSAAGNYVVIDNNGVTSDFVYMHLAAPAPLVMDQYVALGQEIGAVGDTGNSQGCHLHFEYWVNEWYGGGSPIDPLPHLLAWDETS